MSATEEVMGVRYHKHTNIGASGARQDERNEMTETVKDAAGAMFTMGAATVGLGMMSSLLGSLNK